MSSGNVLGAFYQQLRMEITDANFGQVPPEKPW